MRCFFTLSHAQTRETRERDERRERDYPEERERSLGLFGRVISLFSRFFFFVCSL